MLRRPCEYVRNFCYNEVEQNQELTRSQNGCLFLSIKRYNFLSSMTSSRRLENVLKTSSQDVFKAGRGEDVTLKTFSSRLDHGTYRKYPANLGISANIQNNNIKSGFRLSITKLLHREMLRDISCLRKIFQPRKFSYSFLSSTSHTSSFMHPLIVH